LVVALPNEAATFLSMTAVTAAKILIWVSALTVTK
jgi:hypothetical protein